MDERSPHLNMSVPQRVMEQDKNRMAEGKMQSIVKDAGVEGRYCRKEGKNERILNERQMY